MTERPRECWTAWTVSSSCLVLGQDDERPEQEKVPSHHLRPGDERTSITDARCTDMQMVEPDAGSVETRLVAGEIACADCGGELRPWGYARRRTLRDHGKPVSVRPRRSRCRSCMVTHVLLPVLLLLRRADLAATIGEALVARHVERLRRAEVVIAAGAPADTVRAGCVASRPGRRRFAPSSSA